jgi:hypothetical protein
VPGSKGAREYNRFAPVDQAILELLESEPFHHGGQLAHIYCKGAKSASTRRARSANKFQEIPDPTLVLFEITQGINLSSSFI